MQTTCETCALTYDDTYRWTHCPHDGFDMVTRVYRPDGTSVVCTTVEQLLKEISAP